MGRSLLLFEALPRTHLSLLGSLSYPASPLTLIGGIGSARHFVAPAISEIAPADPQASSASRRPHAIILGLFFAGLTSTRPVVRLDHRRRCQASASAVRLESLRLHLIIPAHCSSWSFCAADVAVSAPRRPRDRPKLSGEEKTPRPARREPSPSPRRDPTARSSRWTDPVLAVARHSWHRHGDRVQLTGINGVFFCQLCSPPSASPSRWLSPEPAHAAHSRSSASCRASCWWTAWAMWRMLIYNGTLMVINSASWRRSSRSPHRRYGKPVAVKLPVLAFLAVAALCVPCSDSPPRGAPASSPSSWARCS